MRGDWAVKTFLAVFAVVIALVLIGAWIYADRNSARLLIPLLAAGGLASLVQGLIEKRNVLVMTHTAVFPNAVSRPDLSSKTTCCS
jgi:hypothetical protein